MESLRVDKFVEKHVNYLLGRMLIADANVSIDETDLESPGNVTGKEFER